MVNDNSWDNYFFAVDYLVHCVVFLFSMFKCDSKYP
jgi:hypothetical protein